MSTGDSPLSHCSICTQLSSKTLSVTLLCLLPCAGAGGRALSVGGDLGWVTAGLAEGAGGSPPACKDPISPCPARAWGQPVLGAQGHPHPHCVPCPSTHRRVPWHPGADVHPWAPGLPSPCAPRHDVTRCHGNAAASLRCSAPQSRDFHRGCVVWAAGWGVGSSGIGGCMGAAGGPHRGGSSSSPQGAPCLCQKWVWAAQGYGTCGHRIRTMMGH